MLINASNGYIRNAHFLKDVIAKTENVLNTFSRWSNRSKKMVNKKFIYANNLIENNHILNLRFTNAVGNHIANVKSDFTHTIIQAWVIVYLYYYWELPASLFQLQSFIRNEFNSLLNINNYFKSSAAESTFNQITNKFKSNGNILFIKSKYRINKLANGLLELICNETISPQFTVQEINIFMALRQALVNLIKRNMLSSEDNFLLFEALTNTEHASIEILAAIIELIASGKLNHLDRFKVFDIYANSLFLDPRVEHELDLAMLKLFEENKVLEPKVQSKLLARFASGKIKVSEVDKGIAFYKKLFTNHKELFLIFISAQLFYFINKDGAREIENIIRHLKSGKELGDNYMGQLMVDLQTRLQMN